MKSPRPFWPYALLAFAWLAFAAYVWWSAGQLPDKVATHFGVNGRPNAWQTHTGYIAFMLLFGAAIPAFILTTFAILRRLNGWGLNIPHKDYWLAPERRRATFDFVQRQGIWLALLLVAFFAGVHYFILMANAHAPAQLPAEFAVLAGGFLVATLMWGAKLLSHFSRKPL
jgi:uncharacterized membrane protein